MRAVREKEEEILKLQAELKDKVEKLDTLEGQLEMLRKQVVRSKSASQRSIPNSANKADSNTQDSETQTENMLANGGPSPVAEERHSTRKSRCVIS